MVPIWEQGRGKGIGHSRESFIQRFDSICREHAGNRTAHSFALIFYDLTDTGLKKVLKDHAAFTKLDRLAGERLSIFYLHNPKQQREVQSFNDSLRERLGVSDSGACIVFFNIDQGQAIDVRVCAIGSADAMHGFQELYQVVATYLANEPSEVKTSTKWVTLRSGAKWVTKETISTLIKESLDRGRILDRLSEIFMLRF